MAILIRHARRPHKSAGGHRPHEGLEGPQVLQRSSAGSSARGMNHDSPDSPDTSGQDRNSLMSAHSLHYQAHCFDWKLRTEALETDNSPVKSRRNDLTGEY
jgi:hypothetical protein